MVEWVASPSWHRRLCSSFPGKSRVVISEWRGSGIRLSSLRLAGGRPRTTLGDVVWALINDVAERPAVETPSLHTASLFKRLGPAYVRFFTFSHPVSYSCITNHKVPPRRYPKNRNSLQQAPAVVSPTGRIVTDPSIRPRAELSWPAAIPYKSLRAARLQQFVTRAVAAPSPCRGRRCREHLAMASGHNVSN